MKQTPITHLPFALPEELEGVLAGAKIFDSSCSKEASTYFLLKDEGYFLKRAPLGQLKTEAEMDAFFHEKHLGPQVLWYSSEADFDLLLTRRVDGEDATAPGYLADPPRLAALLGEALRALHETNWDGCPVPDRNKSYFTLAKENHRKGIFDGSCFLGEAPFSSPEEAIALVREGKTSFRREVLLHGDYCLPNVMLKNWRFSAFIDLGNGGVGDRHIDLFWGMWSLQYNLKTSRYGEHFLDAYGRDKIDNDRLRIVQAAECFG